MRHPGRRKRHTKLPLVRLASISTILWGCAAAGILVAADGELVDDNRRDGVTEPSIQAKASGSGAEPSKDQSRQNLDVQEFQEEKATRDEEDNPDEVNAAIKTLTETEALEHPNHEATDVDADEHNHEYKEEQRDAQTDETGESQVIEEDFDAKTVPVDDSDSHRNREQHDTLSTQNQSDESKVEEEEEEVMGIYISNSDDITPHLEESVTRMNGEDEEMDTALDDHGDHEDDDDKSLLDMFGEASKQFLTQEVIPETDEECHWDWRSLRCEPACECLFQGELGDYHLGRSCRRSRFDGHEQELCIPVDPALVLREAPIPKRVISLVTQTLDILTTEVHRFFQRFRTLLIRTWEKQVLDRICAEVWALEQRMLLEQQTRQQKHPHHSGNNNKTCIPASMALTLQTTRSFWEKNFCGPPITEQFPICELPMSSSATSSARSRATSTNSHSSSSSSPYPPKHQSSTSTATASTNDKPQRHSPFHHPAQHFGQ